MSIFSTNVNVPAGETLQLHVHGNFVYARSLSAQIVVEFSSNSVPLSQGQAMRFDEVYQTLILKNEGAAAITGELVLGDGDYRDGQVTGTVSLSSGGIATEPDASIPDTTATVVIAADTLRREAIIQSSPSNVSNIRIGDASVGAAQGLILAPGGSVSLETSGAIYAYHAAGIAQTLQILEVF